MRSLRKPVLGHLRRRLSVLAPCRILHGEAGGALVELALVFSLFGVPLMLGVVSVAQAIYSSIEVSNAAYAGASFGMLSMAHAESPALITAAAQAEAPDFGTSLTVTPTNYWACSNAIGGTQYTGANGQSNANSACTGGTNHTLEFIKVATSATVTTPFSCCGLPASFTVRGSAVMEVQE